MTLLTCCKLFTCVSIEWAISLRNVLEYSQLTYFQLCPDYIGIELGIGESLLIKAIGESTGRSLATIKADLRQEGDLGLVAMVFDSPTVGILNNNTTS
jgi:hypothetical protein